jgi:hypothetical protein
LRDLLDTLAAAEVGGRRDERRREALASWREWLESSRNDVDPGARELAVTYMRDLERALAGPTPDGQDDLRFSVLGFEAITLRELDLAWGSWETMRPLLQLLSLPALLRAFRRAHGDVRELDIGQLVGTACFAHDSEPDCLPAVRRCRSLEIAARTQAACDAAWPNVARAFTTPSCAAEATLPIRFVSAPPGVDFDAAHIVRLESIAPDRTRVVLREARAWTGYVWTISNGARAIGHARESRDNAFGIVEPGVLITDAPIEAMCRSVTRRQLPPEAD